MALKSIKIILAEASLVSPEQFQEWSKAWRVAVENGSNESMLAFFARESGLSEEVFLQRLAEKLGWPFLDSEAPFRHVRRPEENPDEGGLPIRGLADEI